eukprot:g1648.t1
MPAAAAPPPQAPATAKPTPSSAAAPPSAVRSGVGKNTPAPANAFSTLMAASALSSFREEMYLWAHEDGTFSWGWGSLNNPLPPPPSISATSRSTATTTKATSTGSKSSAPNGHRRWLCQVATKGPDGRKAGTCDLWTNLPPAANPSGGSENAGFVAARPGQSLSRLPVAVVKSMLQKNVRRGRAEAAVRCALELALRSWSDAIRRVLVIIVEDSLLHPAAPLLTWLMVATSKGYRPPTCLLEAFLCVVHETTACPVRDSTDSCRHRFRGSQDHRTADSCSPGTATSDKQQQQEASASKSFDDEDFAVPHPKSLLVYGSCRDDAGGGAGGTAAADAAVANIRRALLMRVSYGGMLWDQALLKGACLAWGERCGHYHDCSLCGTARTSATPFPAHALPGKDAPGSDEDVVSLTAVPLLPQQRQPPDPPKWPKDSRSPGGCDFHYERPSVDVGAPPFNYAHESVLSALQGNGWTAFLTAAHDATGMSPALRSQLMAHVARKGGGGGGGDCDGEEGAANRAMQREAGRAKPPTPDASTPPTRLGPILREADAILSGVDFHCSGVLDELLRSTAVSARVGEAIHRRTNKHSALPAGLGATVMGDLDQGGSVETAGGVGGGLVQSDEEEVVGVRQAAKQAMWACSAGLNFRKLGVAFSSRRGEARGQGDGGSQGGDRCCYGCWSSPAFLTQLPGVRAGACGDDDDAVWGDGRGSVLSPDINTRVWSAISSDVFGWTRRFVKGRLARGYQEQLRNPSSGGLPRAR